MCRWSCSPSTLKNNRYAESRNNPDLPNSFSQFLFVTLCTASCSCSHVFMLFVCVAPVQQAQCFLPVGGEVEGQPALLSPVCFLR